MHKLFSFVLTLIMVLSIPLATLAAEPAKDKKIDNEVKFTGSVNYRYDNNSKNNKVTHRKKYETQMGFKQTVNEHFNWQVTYRNATKLQLGEQVEEWSYDESFLQYQNKGLTVDAGYRMPYNTPYSLVSGSSYLNGARVTFESKDSKIIAWHGQDWFLAEDAKYNGKHYIFSNDIGGKEKEKDIVTGISYTTKVAGKLYTGMSVMEAKLLDSGLNTKYTEYGGEYKFTNKLSFIAAYSSSDAEAYNTASAYSLIYGKVNINKPGSFRVKLTHRDIEKAAVLDPQYFKGTGYVSDGLRIDYVPAKNYKVVFDYSNGENKFNSKDRINGYNINITKYF